MRSFQQTKNPSLQAQSQYYRQLNALSHRLKQFKRELKPSEELVSRLQIELGKLSSGEMTLLSKEMHRELGDISSSIQESRKALSDSLKTLKDALKEVDKEKLSPLVYGSKEWDNLVAQRPKKETSLIGKILHNIWHPEEWSDTTKRIVYGLFTGMQLSQQAIGVTQKIEQAKNLRTLADSFQKQVIAAVPEKTAMKINKESSYIGQLLTDKYPQLLTPEGFEHFTKKIPEARDTLAATITRFGTTRPTAKEIDTIWQSHQLRRMVQASPLEHPFKNKGIGEGVMPLWTLRIKRSQQKYLNPANQRSFLLRRHLRRPHRVFRLVYGDGHKSGWKTRMEGIGKAYLLSQEMLSPAKECFQTIFSVKHSAATLLSHTWEIAGENRIEGRDVSLEGSPYFSFDEEVRGAVQAFTKTYPYFISEVEARTLVSSLSRKLEDAEQLFTSFKEGEPVLISTGYWNKYKTIGKRVGQHAIEVSLHNDYLTVANKGASTRKPIEVFKINKNKITRGKYSNNH